MRVDYKGYVAIQSDYNNHITIYKNNKLVMHISATCKYDKDEIENLIDLFLCERVEK